MTPNSTAEERCETVVFEDVTVDPDAVLAAFGTDSPEDIVAEADDGDEELSAGDHRHSATEELESIDVVAEELFRDLQEAEPDDPPIEPDRPETAPDGPETAPDLRETSPEATDADPSSAPELPSRDPPEVVVTSPTVVVDEDGCGFFEELFGDRSTTPSREVDDDSSGLVGPSPEPRRIENESFGVEIQSAPGSDRSGRRTRLERV